MRELFPGSRIPALKDPEQNLNALRAEYGDMISLFRDIEADKDRKGSEPVGVAKCVAACALPDYHNEDTIEAWGEDQVLSAGCYVMMEAIEAIINDPSFKFSDNSIWPRVCEIRRREEPLFTQPDETPEP